MLELMQFVKTDNSFVIADGVGYGPAGSLARIEELVCNGDIVVTRPQGEWPSA